MTFSLSFKVAKLLRNGCNDNNFPMVHTICNSQVSYGFITPAKFYTFQTENELKFLPTSLNARPFCAVTKMKQSDSVEVRISSYNSRKIQQMQPAHKTAQNCSVEGRAGLHRKEHPIIACQTFPSFVRCLINSTPKFT